MEKTVAFFEIPCTDFTRAIRFYENVLGLTFQTYEDEKEKMAFFPEEQGMPCGAISWAEDFLPSENGTLIHLRVKKIDSILEKVVKNGGKVIRSETQIECDGAGSFALFRDSEGNRMGLYQQP